MAINPLIENECFEPGTTLSKRATAFDVNPEALQYDDDSLKSLVRAVKANDLALLAFLKGNKGMSRSDKLDRRLEIFHLVYDSFVAQYPLYKSMTPFIRQTNSPDAHIQGVVWDMPGGRRRFMAMAGKHVKKFALDMNNHLLVPGFVAQVSGVQPTKAYYRPLTKSERTLTSDRTPVGRSLRGAKQGNVSPAGQAASISGMKPLQAEVVDDDYSDAESDVSDYSFEGGSEGSYSDASEGWADTVDNGNSDDGEVSGVWCADDGTPKKARRAARRDREVSSRKAAWRIKELRRLAKERR